MIGPLKVIIDAQLFPRGSAGGVEQFTIGLVSALGKIEDAEEEYIIVGPWQEPDWLASYMGPNQRFVSGPQPQRDFAESAKRLLGPLRSPLGKTGWPWTHDSRSNPDAMQSFFVCGGKQAK